MPLEEHPVSGLPDRALKRAMRLLATRPRSRYEISARLLKAGFEPQEVAGAVARLAELRLVDDKEFAAACVRDAVARGRSAEWIKKDLLQRGVADWVAEDTLSQLGTKESEYERVLELASRRAGAMRKLPRMKAYRRLMGFLCAKGYEPDLAAEVSRKVLGDPPQAE